MKANNLENAASPAAEASFLKHFLRFRESVSRTVRKLDNPNYQRMKFLHDLATVEPEEALLVSIISNDLEMKEVQNLKEEV